MSYTKNTRDIDKSMLDTITTKSLTLTDGQTGELLKIFALIDSPNGDGTSSNDNNNDNTNDNDRSTTRLCVPFAFGRHLFKDYKHAAAASRQPMAFGSGFTGVLRPHQETVYRDAHRLLAEKNSVLIASYPGFGKTITTIKITQDYNLPTLIIVNKLVLVSQWEMAIKQFTSASSSVVQYITTKTKQLNESSKYYIINAINMTKFPRGFFDRVRIVVVDELHQIITKVLLQGLFTVYPDYLIGLSATPYRFDCYDKAISWFFGDDSIGNKLSKQHLVYTVKTGFKPTVSFNFNGLDWNSVLESQAKDDRRNNIIVDVVCKYPTRTWMILVKRIEHAEILKSKFIQLGKTNVATLMGNQLEFDKDCSVLIGTTAKIGVGFDHAKIDALCIAADVKNYFVQFLGRCMRREEIVPIVLDFYDDFGPLQSHYESRKQEYIKHGGRLANGTAASGTAAPTGTAAPKYDEKPMRRLKLN